MLSATQESLCSGIVCQYDFYLVYYRYDYTEYTVGTDRDYLIEIFVSDELPTIEDDEYIFTECIYYQITDNKYISKSDMDSVIFSPNNPDDLIYTNTVDGAPQLCYVVSEFRNFDFSSFILYVFVSFLAIFLVCKLVFGGVH